MGTALSIFVLLSVSVFVIRVASVALRLTGLDEGSARFQALSAFSGTGFTTRESEAIVNYPVRRRIIMMLMIIGNLGLVSVVATVVVSFVHTDGDHMAMLRQFGWLLAGLGLLWLLILNRFADRLMCALIGRVLHRATELGHRRFDRLLQLGSGISVCEHPVPVTLLDSRGRLDAARLDVLGLDVIGLHLASGERQRANNDSDLRAAYRVVLYGEDRGHEAFARDTGGEATA